MEVALRRHGSILWMVLNKRINRGGASARVSAVAKNINTKLPVVSLSGYFSGCGFGSPSLNSRFSQGRGFQLKLLLPHRKSLAVLGIHGSPRLFNSARGEAATEGRFVNNR
jgi:hypothetical protein